MYLDRWIGNYKSNPGNIIYDLHNLADIDFTLMSWNGKHFHVIYQPLGFFFKELFALLIEIFLVTCYS